MKKIIVICSMLCLTWAPGVMADAFTNSGVFIGIYTGNDNEMDELASWLIDEGILGEDCELTKFGKYETDKGLEPGFGWVDITFEQDINGNEVDDPDGLYGGYWFTGEPIDFYGLKAGNDTAMFALDPTAASEGTWSTLGIPGFVHDGGQPIELSHFTGSQTDCAPVPEPATMLLFGTGMAGLAGYARKKKK